MTLNLAFCVSDFYFLTALPPIVSSYLLEIEHFNIINVICSLTSLHDCIFFPDSLSKPELCSKCLNTHYQMPPGNVSTPLVKGPLWSTLYVHYLLITWLIEHFLSEDFTNFQSKLTSVSWYPRTFSLGVPNKHSRDWQLWQSALWLLLSFHDLPTLIFSWQSLQTPPFLLSSNLNQLQVWGYWSSRDLVKRVQCGQATIRNHHILRRKKSRNLEAFFNLNLKNIPAGLEG